MVSALTLLQSEDSQAGRRRWSYLLLADEIRRASGRPKEDLRELFARITETARGAWHATMRRAGVSDRDCGAIASAFFYEGLFFETAGRDV